MSVTGLILVSIAAMITMVANFLMRLGIDRSGGFSPNGAVDALFSFFMLMLEPRFALGFLAYFVAGLVWFRVVASEPLSLAYPLLVSTTFVLVTTGSILLFNESLSTTKIGGLVLILVGIALVSFAQK